MSAFDRLLNGLIAASLRHRVFVKASRQGLGERRIVGCKGKTETRFLDGLDEIAASGRTRADYLLHLYETSWQHDVGRVFRDFAY